MSRNVYTSSLTSVELELRVHHLEERVARLEALVERTAAAPATRPVPQPEVTRPTA